jgi:predicted dehydrogenase
MSARLRIGVIGGGLIAQAIHVPNLARLSDAFELVAVADQVLRRDFYRLADRRSGAPMAP